MCAVQVSSVLKRHQHLGDDGINAHILAYTRMEQEWMVCPLFFIPVVVMYWEARMRFHKQKHTLAEPCLFHVLFITNHIADALSDLSWTVVLARAEPCVENRTVQFFSANRATPSGYRYIFMDFIGWTDKSFFPRGRYCVIREREMPR